MDNENISTEISPLIPNNISRRFSLSASTSAIPRKFDSTSKEDSWGYDGSQKLEYIANGENSWGSACKPMTKSTELLERPASASSIRIPKRRRASCADISIHGFNKGDPESPCSKQKRHRRTAAEIERGFKCAASNCHKAYGTEGALKMHMRIKHPSLNTPSPSSSSGGNTTPQKPQAPHLMINTNVVHQLSIPTNISNSPSTPTFSPIDSPGFESKDNVNVKLEQSNSFSNSIIRTPSLARSTPGSPALSLKLEPPGDDTSQTTQPTQPTQHQPPPIITTSSNPVIPVTPSLSSPIPLTPLTPSPANVLPETWAPNCDQIRYSNVPVLILKIGSWHKGTLFCGDIVAKFLYEERKFVWEVYAVTTSVTTFFVRMDLNFDDIVGIGFENHQEITVLTIDFSGPPTFHQAEIIPHQPMIWRPLAIDVSGGDIFTCRRHILHFGKDSVMQPLQHLLKVEPRLQQLYKNYENNYYTQFATQRTLSNNNNNNNNGNGGSNANNSNTNTSTSTTTNSNTHNNNNNININSHNSNHNTTVNISNTNKNHNFTNYLNANLNTNLNAILSTSLNLNSSTSSTTNSSTNSTTNSTTTSTTTCPTNTPNSEEDDTELDSSIDDDDISSNEDASSNENDDNYKRLRAYANPHGNAGTMPYMKGVRANAHKGYADAAVRVQQVDTYLNHTFIPSLELDPKDKESPASSPEQIGDEIQRMTHYGMIMPVSCASTQQCMCLGDCSSYDCSCFKGLESCGPLCACSTSVCGNPLNDGDISFPEQSISPANLALGMEVDGGAGGMGMMGMMGMMGIGMGMGVVGPGMEVACAKSNSNLPWEIL